MKKRGVIFLGIILSIVSMISCNAKEIQVEEREQIEEEAPIQKDTLKVGKVYIGDEIYDLTQEPKAVIGSMVTDGVIVVESLIGYLYDTNGSVSGKDLYTLGNEVGEIGNLVEVHIDNVSATYSSNVILAEFVMGYEDTVYETWDGITQYSKEEEINCLKDYVPCAVSANRPAYACIYVDGKPMSLQAYEESLKVLMKAQEDGQLKETLSEYVKDVSYSPKAITWLRKAGGMDGLKDRFNDEEIEGALGIILAVQDAGRMLDSAEITSYDIVVYEKTEDRMLCKVYHHYYDDAWDATKYLK